MTDLSPTLMNNERQHVFDRLWQIIAMIDGGRSRTDIRLALRYTAEEVQPPIGSRWPKSKPENMEAA